MSEEHRPILVTGSHRSGSTWVGQMIATSPGVGYIHEPFALHHHPGVFAMKVPYWFMYVTDENAAEFRGHLAKTLRFSYSPLAELKAARRPRHLARLLIDGKHFLRYRLAHGRPLMKDPLALFSSEWLATEFDMDVVLLVRHPAAFAASLRRLGFRHPFSHFLLQPQLMQDRLEPFADEIRAMDLRPHNVLEEAALLWHIITRETLDLHDEHPDWAFYRYEDLIEDPAGRFADLFARLNLAFSPEIRDGILRRTNPKLTSWREQMTGSEVELLRQRVGELADPLYPATDW